MVICLKQICPIFRSLTPTFLTHATGLKKESKIEKKNRNTVAVQANLAFKTGSAVYVYYFYRAREELGETYAPVSVAI